jgi:NDP-sugar pyrophosphorylase family protein
MSSDAIRTVILAGGKGTRLRPYTMVLPKPLVPVGDMPILEIVIRQLAAQGFRHLTVAVGHLAELIQSFFGNGSKWGVTLEYSIEDQELSTIAPLKLIRGLKGDFLVMNGDVLTDLDFRKLVEFHRSRKAALTVATCLRETMVDFGVLQVGANHLVVGFEEKPRKVYLVSMGVYVLNQRVLPMIPTGTPFGFDQLVPTLLGADEEVACYPHEGYWLDIGRPDDYERAVNDFEAVRSRLLPATVEEDSEIDALPAEEQPSSADILSMEDFDS